MKTWILCTAAAIAAIVGLWMIDHDNATWLVYPAVMALIGVVNCVKIGFTGTPMKHDPLHNKKGTWGESS